MIHSPTEYIIRTFRRIHKVKKNLTMTRFKITKKAHNDWCVFY